jgi:hypothetical protein
MWDLLKYVGAPDYWENIGYNLLSIEFGLNIIGVNDWRKKKKRKSCVGRTTTSVFYYFYLLL